jgi:hypothetical protein
MTPTSSLPTRKVGSGVDAGAVVTILVWIIDATTGVEMPPEVAAALVTVITLVTSYFVPETPAPTTPTEPLL